MRVIAKSALVTFWGHNPWAKAALSSWFVEISRGHWKNPADLRESFGSVSVLKNGRVVFNVAGNKLRVVASISFPIQVLYIKFVGTHENYDKIDAQTVEYRG